MEPAFGPTTTASYGSKARRPARSVLVHGGLNRAGLEHLRRWDDALNAYLAEKKDY